MEPRNFLLLDIMQPIFAEFPKPCRRISENLTWKTGGTIYLQHQNIEHILEIVCIDNIIGDTSQRTYSYGIF